MSVSLCVEGNNSETGQEQGKDFEEVATETSQRRSRTEHHAPGTTPAGNGPKNTSASIQQALFCAAVRKPGRLYPLRR